MNFASVLRSAYTYCIAGAGIALNDCAARKAQSVEAEPVARGDTGEHRNGPKGTTCAPVVVIH